MVSSASVAPDERPIEKIADADREGDNAEGGDRPDVAIRLNAGNQSESCDIAECATDEQNSCTAGTRRLVQFRLHRNVNSASNGREPFLAAQLADPVISIQRAEGDSHPQNHGN